jgi:tetratricopeptide (TPR) repeat protein
MFRRSRYAPSLTAGAVIIGTALTAAAVGYAQARRVAAPGSTTAEGNRIAIVVGVADYAQTSDMRPLKYTVSDAQAIHDELKAKGYAVRMFLNGEASADAIREQLEDYADAAKDGTVLFYFAGHGVGDQETVHLATHGVTLRSLRTSGLRLKDIDRLLAATGARRRIIWLDACRNDPEAPGSRSSMYAGRTPVEFTVSEGTRVLYSTASNRQSYEYDELKHGVFTHFLVKGLQGEAANADGNITFDDLGDYVTASVRDWTIQNGHTQTPRKGGEHSGDFLIARHTGPRPAASRPANTLVPVPPPAGPSPAASRPSVADVAAIADAAVRTEIATVRQMHDDERWGDSLPILNRLLVQSPNNVELLALRSHTYAHLDRTVEAVTDGEQAVRLGPRVAEAYLRRGEARMGDGKHKEAIADFDTAIKLNPKDAETWGNRGASLSAINQQQQALDSFSEGLRLDSQRADLWAARGGTQNSLGRHQAATDDFTEALRLRPRSTNALIGRAVALMQQQKLDAALADVNQALRISPDEPEALGVRGAINMELGRTQQAREDLGYALRLRPELTFAADLLNRLDADARATPATRNPPGPEATRDPAGGLTYARLQDDVLAAMRAQRLAEAGELVEQMIRLDPARPDGYSLRGALLMWVDNLAGAYQSYEAALARGGGVYFRVAHDHSTDQAPCFGVLTISPTGVTYAGETGGHQFQFPYGSITEAAINDFYGSAVGMFHFKAQDGRRSATFNFVVVRPADTQIVNRRPDAEMLLGFVNRRRAALGR